MMDRVAIVAFIWFGCWIAGFAELGKVLFHNPGVWAIWGFVLALLTVFAWPWVLPARLERWMHDLHPE